MSKAKLFVGMVFTLAAVGALLAYLERNRGFSRTTVVSGAGDISQREFETWDAFLSSDEWRQSQRQQVVFIGVDGGAWNIIDPMIEAGGLPMFERLKREGSFGILRSVDCYVSPPAWATMMTGCLPVKTGIYTFGHWNGDSKEFLPLSSEDVMVPSVWDISALAQKRAAVTNVPLTYPVRDPNGIMVSGLMTPITLNERRGARLQFQVYEPTRGVENMPPSDAPLLRAILDHDDNRYGFILRDSQRDGRVIYDKVHLQIQSTLSRGTSGQRDRIYSFGVGEYSPWLQINHRQDETSQESWCKLALYPMAESDHLYRARFSQTLFSAGDTDIHFTHPDSLAQLLVDEFEYYFPSKFLDREIVPSFTDDAARFASFFYQYEDWDLFLYVFTETDNIQHLEGVTPTTRQVYQTIDRFLGKLVQSLPQYATLIIASDHGFKEYVHSIDLNKVFEQLNLLTYGDEQQIDYEKTVVFHNLWCIYFNEALLSDVELQKRGLDITSGVSPRETLIRHLQTAGRQLSSDDNRLNVPIEFVRVDESSIGYAPDLVVQGTYTDYLVEFWNLQRPRDTWLRPLRLDEKWNHTRDGIYLVHGNGVKRGFEGPVINIQDVAPTMLYLLDLPVARNMDGRVMASIFEPQYVAQRPRFVVSHYDQIPQETVVSDEQRESLEKKLRNLGYIR